MHVQMAKHDGIAPSFGSGTRTKAAGAAADATIPTAESTRVDGPAASCLFEFVKLLDSVPGLRALVEKAADSEGYRHSSSVKERLHCFMDNCCAVRFDNVEIRHSANMMLVSRVELS